MNIIFQKRVTESEFPGTVYLHKKIWKAGVSYHNEQKRF